MTEVIIIGKKVLIDQIDGSGMNLTLTGQETIEDQEIRPDPLDEIGEDILHPHL